MRTTLIDYMYPRYRVYVEQVRSYCLTTGTPFVQPTISQFLSANAMTRDRLTASEEGKPVAD